MGPVELKNHPKSPCNKCPMGYESKTCGAMCETWREWFTKRWTRIQGKKATETWEQQFAKKWTGIQIAAGLHVRPKEQREV